MGFLDFFRRGRTAEPSAPEEPAKAPGPAPGIDSLSAVLDRLPVGVLIVNVNGRVTLCNRESSRLLEGSAPEITGRSATGLLLDPAFDQALRRVLAGGEREDVAVHHAGGLSLGIQIMPLPEGSGAHGALLILQDVGELNRADAMRRDFVANVSHELRTPLTSIRALVETIQLQGRKRPELADEYIPRIVAECERMQRLTDDLLLLAQTESGQLPLQLGAVRVDELVEGVVMLLQPLAEAAGTSIAVRDCSGLEVWADPEATAQCLRNLVENGLRYAAGGSIVVSATPVDGRVRLVVADDGPGIPPEHMPRIWERFYRVDRHHSRASGGSGLGLSLVRRLMAAQGGRAGAESTLGAGSSFWLELPAAPTYPAEGSASRRGTTAPGC